MGRRKFTDKMVRALKRPRKGRRLERDLELACHFIRVPASGPPIYTVIVKVAGKQTWEVVGSSADMSIEEAREKARGIIKRIKAGEPPPTEPQSVTTVLHSWLDRHVAKSGLKSEPEVRRIVARHIVPRIGKLDFLRLKRSNVIALLDQVEDEHTAMVADTVLITLRRAANWMQGRGDDYDARIFRGIKRRVTPHLRERARILDDAELTRLWKAAENAGVLGDILRLEVLTGQRREKIYKLKWTDIDPNGIWTVPQAANEKGTGGRLPLPTTARAIIAAQPRFASSDLVFPRRFGCETKRRFQQSIGVEFRQHDLRRQCRSMLARLGIPFETAEAIMGHRLPASSGIYDRFDRTEPKGIALQRLDDLIQSIVNPSPNVVALLPHGVAVS
jgi:integrase